MEAIEAVGLVDINSVDNIEAGKLEIYYSLKKSGTGLSMRIEDEAYLVLYYLAPGPSNQDCAFPMKLPYITLCYLGWDYLGEDQVGYSIEDNVWYRW